MYLYSRSRVSTLGAQDKKDPLWPRISSPDFVEANESQATYVQSWLKDDRLGFRVMGRASIGGSVWIQAQAGFSVCVGL